MSDDILSRERIAEIERLKNTLPVVGTQCGDNVMVVVSLRDLLRERNALLDIIRVQLESSGDCRCMGCQRGREALTKTGRLT